MSTTSTSGSIASYAKKIGQNGRPEVEIHLDGHHDGKAYTTFDAILGKASITAPQNAQLDEIQITLEGVTRTYVETVSPSAATCRTTAVHRFLKLVMPIRATSYPSPRVAEAGKTYVFPFNFVVPQQLLPTACSHERDADHVHLAHLQLPPSLSNSDSSIQDDLSPAMSKIQYSINVKLIKHQGAERKPTPLAEGSKRLHIIPAIPEAPPVNIGVDEDNDYKLSSTKVLRKGVFSGKLGKITVSSTQTRAIVLPAPGSSSQTGTMATVKLRFDPHDASSQPPRLGGLVTRIRASTYFAARPSKTFPTKSNLINNYEGLRQLYQTSVPLSSRCVEKVSWTKQLPEPAYSRRGSAVSSDSSDLSDSPLAKTDGFYYTAEILVPVTLPSTKTWLPSFHSCIMSRWYTLDLTLSVHTPGTGVPASSVSLKVPIQIASEGNRMAPVALTAAEAAAELAGANEYLIPRVIEIPREELVQNSVLRSSTVPELPPSYEDFEASRRQVVDPSRC